MNFTEFPTWAILASFTGAAGMTALIVQLTKGWVDKAVKLPTQIYSYFVSLVVLYPAFYFTGQLDASNAVLILYCGVAISLTSNGGYAAVTKGAELLKAAGILKGE